MDRIPPAVTDTVADTSVSSNIVKKRCRLRCGLTAIHLPFDTFGWRNYLLMHQENKP
jgi:hypothetical protein